jgi:hypothetical protein
MIACLPAITWAELRLKNGIIFQSPLITVTYYTFKTLLFHLLYCKEIWNVIIVALSELNMILDSSKNILLSFLKTVPAKLIRDQNKPKLPQKL